MSEGVRCMWMRGGTSKGGYFLAEDLPSDPTARDEILLRIMGSPDRRQIDGMGGADPLTSKVAIVKASSRPDADVDYLFLQVSVDRPTVSDGQNCGNILAGVGPFAIERGLVDARGDNTEVAIYMENTDQIAVATVATPGRQVCYDGDAQIDGVPKTHAPVLLEFRETAGSTCGALLPSGRAVDIIDGVACTLIDGGMPCVILTAEEMGLSGYESRETLDANAALKARLEEVRLQAGHLMSLGDVGENTIPKMMLVAPPKRGGAITVRSFIPHRVHASIGVLGAVTVATACLVEGSSAAEVAIIPPTKKKSLSIEHPSGEFTCSLQTDEDGSVVSAAALRTARKLMDGFVF